MSTSAPPVFVMPHYRPDGMCLTFFPRTFESLLEQTDPRWRLVIINDGCTNPGCESLFSELTQKHPERVSVITLPQHFGTGYARNVAVKNAGAAGAPFVMFQDDDDLANPRRVEVTRRLFGERPDVGFIYSGFIPIDHYDRVVPRELVRLDMLEVLEAVETDVVEGDRAWIKIATVTGFIATTSTVSVRTDVALAIPFPESVFSEDSHAWMRMSASGTRFAFAPEIPTKYRMEGGYCSDLGYNARDSRTLMLKAKYDIEGFNQAVALALERGDLLPAEVARLATAFYRRLAVTINRQGYAALARLLRQHAEGITGKDPLAVVSLEGL
ncbi:MAG: glycosyltransferase family 2 protein [Pyrinomonadaceae bacterium]